LVIDGGPLQAPDTGDRMLTMINRIVLLILASTFACTAIAQQPLAPQNDDSTLTQLFKVDQAARQSKNVDWTKLRAEDEERRRQIRHMLDVGEVRTATDYFHAALVFSTVKHPRTTFSRIFSQSTH
jgi:hypothetical protein